MSENKIYTVLERLRKYKKLEPYINYIRFPSYKNLDQDLRIDFDFPLTAIVGQNGTNKSSVLRAIYGCPDGYSVGNFWFSTDIDPISDSSRSRYIYSYFQLGRSHRGGWRSVQAPHRLRQLPRLL